MRRIVCVLPVLLLACANTADDCHKTKSCGPYDGSLDGGAAGTSGASGAPTAGTAGTAGHAGVAGATAGEAGTTAGGGQAGTASGGASDSAGTAGQAGGVGAKGGEAGAPLAGQGGTAPQGGQAGAGGAPPICADVDLTASPGDEPCTITEELGVFLSPTGDDESGAGTRELPYATLARAIEVATEAGKRVYACATEGDYVEALRLDDTATNLQIYGGFDCTTWEYDTTLQANIAPDAALAAIAEGADGLVLADVAIAAADATSPGESSIALSLLDTDAELIRVKLTAGMGAAGQDGSLVEWVEGVDWPAIGDLNGDAGTSVDGGALCRYNTCPGGGETQGGVGGGPESSGRDGASGTATPEPAQAGMGQGNTVAECSAGTIGGAGSPGAPGTDGVGASNHGTLTSTGWTPASGTGGIPGGPGQGGGGGASRSSAGGGGGGGCGACGGNGASPGTGGGSSIALVVHESTISLTECTLTAGAGGTGGAARAGQDGQSASTVERGGLGGDGAEDACDGGSGGIGGPGGASGGGAGGLSVGILFAGTAPNLDSASTDAISTATPGLGGMAVTDKPDTAGLDGNNHAVVEV